MAVYSIWFGNELTELRIAEIEHTLYKDGKEIHRAVSSISDQTMNGFVEPLTKLMT
ncbi:MAG TPA: hypothetical protein V6D11_31595 [Waterburya sp.]